MTNPITVPALRVHKHEISGRCFACGMTEYPTFHIQLLSHQSVIILCEACALGMKALLETHTQNSDPRQ